MENKRLTKKVGENYCSQSGDFWDLYNKLGKLEDLEEQLGLSIEEMWIVCKLIKNKYVYVPFEVQYNNIFIKDKVFTYYGEDDLTVVPFCDYKKTWWFKKDKSE